MIKSITLGSPIAIESKFIKKYFLFLNSSQQTFFILLTPYSLTFVYHLQSTTFYLSLWIICITIIVLVFRFIIMDSIPQILILVYFCKDLHLNMMKKKKNKEETSMKSYHIYSIQSCYHVYFKEKLKTFAYIY